MDISPQTFLDPTCATLWESCTLCEDYLALAQFQHEVDKVVVFEAVVVLDNVLMGAILMDLDLCEELFR